MNTDNNHRYHPVTLVDDPAFLGYVFARYVDDDGHDTNQIAVSVSRPGHTELHGCVRLPEERLKVIG